MGRKKKFDELNMEDKKARILSALKRGRTIQNLVSFLDTRSAYDLEWICRGMRDEGLLLVTNKLWYRRDIPLKPEEPKSPRITEKMEKFLRKQGNLF